MNHLSSVDYFDWLIDFYRKSTDAVLADVTVASRDSVWRMREWRPVLTDVYRKSTDAAFGGCNRSQQRSGVEDAEGPTVSPARAHTEILF